MQLALLQLLQLSILQRAGWKGGKFEAGSFLTQCLFDTSIYPDWLFGFKLFNGQLAAAKIVKEMLEDFQYPRQNRPVTFIISIKGKIYTQLTEIDALTHKVARGLDHDQ